ncbi:hypothetical protein CSW58_05710 [Caulobacter sp. B11]|uniref:DUF4238 domain-containing protein n=1 Tax=Caulobacter sp. B11 TaxID=2048899 RepID=UPI000C12B753|nr:DUF4238 domain-containing protein [Caulobacter sp. B11]PHY13446.1 hypothetical protein CSW58_05710 [Caulobacter sp. B11]
MSIPLDHHYLPEFFQKRWTADADPLVWRFTRPYQKLDVKRVYPSQAGFVPGLYSVPSRQDPVAKQALESGFMTPLDTLAAEALRYIEEHGKRPEDPKLHDGWTRFVMSLIYRNPRAVAHLRKKVRENDEATWADIEARYSAMKSPDDPPTYEEYRRAAGTSLTDESEAKLIASMIDNAAIGTYLNSMHWRFIEFGDPKHSLLLSDDPVMMSNGLRQLEGFLIVPVGPRTMFIAVNDLRVLEAFVSQGNRMQRALNDAVVRQADHQVIGSDESHRAFIDRRFKVAPKESNEHWSGAMRLTWKAPIVWKP